MTESRKVMQAIELSIQMNVDKNKILQVFNKVVKAPELQQFTVKEMNIVEAHLLNLIALNQDFPNDWDLRDEIKRFEYVYTKKRAL